MSSRFSGKICILSGLLLSAIFGALHAQEKTLEELPGLRERAVVMNIVSRIIDQGEQVVWDSENKKITMPGRPVGIKLVGADLIVAVQFTPFLRSNGHHTLVAQGQIWINIPNEGISYHTTMQTIPLAFGEQVYFFPLGSTESKQEEEAYIEIQLVLEPYATPQTDAHQGRDSNSGQGNRQGRNGRGSTGPNNSGAEGNNLPNE
jgi:hypothetical protein